MTVAHFGPQYEVGDLVMVLKPTMKTDQTNKFKSVYTGPQEIREKINDLIFTIEDVKTKKTTKGPLRSIQTFKQ